MLPTRFRQVMIWLVEVDNNKSTLPVVFSGRSESSFPKKGLEIEAILTREIPVKTPTTIVNNLTFLFVLLVYSFFGRRRRLSNCPGIFLSVLLLEILCLTRLRQIGSLVLFCSKSKTKTLWHFFLNFIANRLTVDVPAKRTVEPSKPKACKMRSYNIGKDSTCIGQEKALHGERYI